MNEIENILINSFKSRDYEKSFEQASEIKKKSKTARMILCNHYLFGLHVSFDIRKAEGYCLKAEISKRDMLKQAKENYCKTGLLTPKDTELCSYFKSQLAGLESK